MSRKVRFCGCFYIFLIISKIICIGYSFKIDFARSSGPPCVTHFVDSDSGLNQATTDIIEDILALSNDDNAGPWTISSLPLPKKGVSDRSFFLNTEFTNTEFCSVNIFIQIQSTTNRFIKYIFGSRLYNEQNTLIYVHEISWLVKNKAELRTAPILCDVFFMFVNLKNNGKLEHVISNCIGCTSKHKTMPYPETIYPSIQLKSLSEFASSIKIKSMEPKIGGVTQIPAQHAKTEQQHAWRTNGFLYKLRPSSDSFQIRNIPSHILMENVAAHLNISLEFIFWKTASSAMNFIIPSWRGYRDFLGVVMMDARRFELDYPLLMPKTLLTYFYESKENYQFIYCTEPSKNKELTENFSHTFWIVPLDFWSWVFLLLSGMVLTVLLYGNCFEIFAILMRQSCSVLQVIQTILANMG